MQGWWRISSIIHYFIMVLIYTCLSVGLLERVSTCGLREFHVTQHAHFVLCFYTPILITSDSSLHNQITYFSSKIWSTEYANFLIPNNIYWTDLILFVENWRKDQNWKCVHLLESKFSIQNFSSFYKRREED